MASQRIRAKKYVLKNYYVGEPKESDFEIVEEELPELKEGEILTEAVCWSVDPYMRSHMIYHKVPIDMIGRQMAKVIESRNSDYPVGCHVVDSFGWRTHTICNPATANLGRKPPLFRVPDVGSHPLSISLGILDVPGTTAYFGVTEICSPKLGETFVVTGAAGAVGSHVGQLAKMLGCTVIGFTGSDAKCDHLVKDLGFDYAFNYKTTDIIKALKEAAPHGVDCYFDNVGGEISYKIMTQMNKHGRVALCGYISHYNDIEPPKGPLLDPVIVAKELKIEGFVVYRWINRWSDSMKINLKMVKDGKLKYREQVYYGFENFVKTLNSVLRGENIGKAILKANKDV